MNPCFTPNNLHWFSACAANVGSWLTIYKQKEEMKDILIPIVSFIASLFVVILFIAFGWYVIWTLFLKKFKFVRELIGASDSETDIGEKPRRTSRAKQRRD